MSLQFKKAQKVAGKVSADTWFNRSQRLSGKTYGGVTDAVCYAQATGKKMKSLLWIPRHVHLNGYCNIIDREYYVGGVRHGYSLSSFEALQQLAWKKLLILATREGYDVLDSIDSHCRDAWAGKNGMP